MRTLKRLLSRQATVALATHVVDDGFRYDCRTPKLVANAPSTFSTAASQPACGSCPTGAQPPKSWPTTCPFASMSGDPELPPYVPPTSLEIGRASCRERGQISVVAVSLKKK